MPDIDAAATAIAHASRRTVVERLVTGPATVSELAALLEVSLPATLKHLDRLEEGGVVQRSKHGRVVTVTLVPGALEPLGEWAARTRLFWSHHLDRYAAHLGAESSHRDEGSGP